MIIKSKKTQTQTHLYSAVFEIDRSGESKEINESFLVDETSAKNRAKAEFLEYGYDKQVVEFETYFSDININDIIVVYAPSYRIPAELNKDRFIVKSISHIYQEGKLKSKIKAVRYD